MLSKKYSEYLPDFVYGSIDGTITTFAIVSGALGADLSAGVVLVLGIANVLADGFSMASGNYLSEKSERDLSGEEATKNPLTSAFITFASFVAVGLIPILPFIVKIFVPMSTEQTFMTSIALTIVAFVYIGLRRAKVAKEATWLSVVETLLVGGAAAVISFGVGYLLRSLAGV